MSGIGADFDAVHEEFRPRIRRYLTRLAGPHEAEDLTQEVFARVAAGLADFRGESRLSTWIYRIASHAAIDRARSAASHGGVAEPLPSDPPDPADGADTRAMRLEMGGCLRDLVDRLPMEHRTVLILSDLEELTDREIAEVLGITVGAAKIRLHRARTRLRRSIEAGCDVGRDSRDELACEPKLLRIVSGPGAVSKVGERSRGG